MLKAGIYDPYLDSLGGGERYCLTVAEILLQHGYEVDLFWSGDPQLLSLARDRFNLDISRVNLVPDIFQSRPKNLEYLENPGSLSRVISRPVAGISLTGKITRFLHKINTTRNYDLIFFLSDWSIPLLLSANNLLHIQVPLNVSLSTRTRLINWLKLRFIKKIICNSRFTYQIAGRYFGHGCAIVYPPVDVEKFASASSKKNIILSVGRFDDILNIKKQDVMIFAFQRLLKHKANSGWKLILAGASLELPEKNRYLKHLQSLAAGFPVEFVINPGFTELSGLYANAKIYWHAAGYEIDEIKHPEHTEHFGIAPVEAMAAGAVPLVVSKGGLPEIIDDGKNGFLWNDLDTLVSKTTVLINSPSELSRLSAAAIAKSASFSKSAFTDNLLKYIRHD